MPSPRPMNELQMRVKTLYESGEMTYLELAEYAGVSEGTIDNWRKKYNWSRDTGELQPVGDIAPVLDDGPGPVHVDTPSVTESVLEGEIERLRLELEQANQRAIAAEAQAAANAPYVDISSLLYTTPEGVIEHFGVQTIQDIVNRERGEINKDRISQGLDRIELNEDEMRRSMVDVATRILNKRRDEAEDNPHRTRVIKLVHVQTGNVIQVPVEEQVNNSAGSRYDAVATYTHKVDRDGNPVFKLTNPAMCASLNCWWVAAATPDGRLDLDGYCSEDHRSWVEFGKRARTGMQRNPALSQVVEQNQAILTG